MTLYKYKFYFWTLISFYFLNKSSLGELLLNAANSLSMTQLVIQVEKEFPLSPSAKQDKLFPDGIYDVFVFKLFF